MVLGAAYGAWQSLAQRETEGPVTIKRMEFYVRRHHDDRTLKEGAWLLVHEGVEQAAHPIDPLGPDDDLKLVAQFSRPTYWYLLWFDTRGEIIVQAHSEIPSTGMEYPAGPNYVTVDEADPTGIHLLLLVAGSIQPPAGQNLLERHLEDLPRPPEVLPPQWAQLRAGGKQQAPPFPLPI
jgi:hypothetical protein